MAITRYAGDRFVIGSSPDVEPTGVLDGAFLINTGNLSQKVLRNGTWTTLAGGGGGGSPGGDNTQVQFNNAGSFAGSTGLTFDGQRLYANNFQLSGILYDSNASVGEGGMVLANEGTTGVHWKNIESVLSGVGGSGVADYVAKWSDEDTLTSGTIYDDGNVGIGTIAPAAKLDVTHDGAWARLGYDSHATFQFYRNLPASSTSLPVMIVRQTHPDDDQTALIVDQDGSGNILELIEDSTTRVVVKADGNVGIGTPTPDDILDVTTTNGQLLASDYGVLKLIRGTAGDYGSALQFIKSDNGGAVTDGAILGSVRFFGHDGIDTATEGAQIASIINGTPSANVNPTDIVFKTASTGNDDLAEKVRIMSDGNVGIGVSNPSDFHSAGSRLVVGNGVSNQGITIYAANDAASQINFADGSSGNASYKGIVSYDHSADKMNISTAATIGMSIDSGGDVGIGTSTPGYRLDVYDTVANIAIFRSTITSYARVVIRAGATGDAQLTFQNNTASKWTIGNDGGDSDKFKIEAGGGAFGTSPLVCILSGGNFGIGVAAPSTSLHIRKIDLADDSRNALLLIDGKFAAAGVDSGDEVGIAFRVENSGGGAQQTTSITSSYQPTHNSLNLQPAGGKVGIGTTDPGYLLDLYGSFGSSAGAALRLRSSANDDLGIIWQQANGNQWFAGPETSKPNDFEFWSYDGSAWTNVLHLNQDGKVGIGTNAPTSISASTKVLHLYGTNAELKAETNNGGGWAFSHYKTPTDSWTVGADNDDKFRISSGTDLTGDARLTILGDGNVGIGTDAPEGKLQVVQGGAGRKSTFSTSLGLTIQANDNSVPAALNLVNTYAGANYGTTLGYQLGYSGSSSATGELVDAGKITVAATQTWTDVPNTQDSYMTFQTAKNGSLSEHVRINQDGEVGIGTDDPIAQLHISGADTSDQVLIQNSSASSTSAPDLVLDRPSTTPAGGDNIGLLQFRGRNSAGESINYASLLTNIVDKTDGDEDGKLSFYTCNAGTETESMVIKSNYVGIGVILPEHKLHVAGDAIISGYLYDSTNSTGVDGYVLTSKEDGPQWKMIEDVLSGVGGDGTAEYIPRWVDADTIGDSVIAQSGSAIGINMNRC